MKIYMYCVFMIPALMVVGCQESFDAEKEKEAIIKLINAETDAYINFDFAALAEKHLLDSTNLRLSAGRDAYVFLKGWEQIADYLKEAMKEDEAIKDVNVTVEKSNYRIKVYDECAWVVCDEKWTYVYTTETVEIKSVQVRFLEKIDGEWKISFISFVGTSGYDELDEAEEIIDLVRSN